MLDTLREVFNHRRRVVVLLLFIPLAVSIYIHAPGIKLPVDNFGFKYTDIIHGVFNNIYTKPERWFNSRLYSDFKNGLYKCPIPYIDYKFEYPPLIGVLWYLSTCTGFTVTSDLESASVVHYYFQSAIISVFYILLVITLYSLIAQYDRDWIRLVILLLPSWFIYTVYNWDVVAVSLALLGVLFANKKKSFLAGVFHGLSVSSKLLTLGIVYYYGVKYLLVEREKRLFRKYVFGFLITGLIPFITMYLLSPTGFTAFINHHLSWYCENCIYLPLIRDIWSDLHRRLYFAIAATFAIAFPLLIPPWRSMKTETEWKYLFAAITTLVLFNHVFSPQMILLISPFAALALNPGVYLVYGLCDTANALIILTFFQYSKPQEFGSIPQYMATMRNLILLILFFYIVGSIVKERVENTSVGADHGVD